MSNQTEQSASPWLRTVVLVLAAFGAGFLVGTKMAPQAAAPLSPVEAPAPVASAAVPKGSPALGFLDMVNGQPVIQAEAGTEVKVSGWAGCAAVDSPVSRLEVHVDRKVVVTVDAFYNRPDVAQAYNLPHLLQSGWQTTFMAKGLAAGEHKLGAKVYCAKGETAELPPFRLLIAK
jgi:hypothetical protein